MHVPPGATGRVQAFFVIANSAALSPEIAAPETFSDTGPVLSTVTTFSGPVVLTFWLRKFTMAGEALSADCPPVPLSATVWVAPASVTSRLALSALALAGVKVTAIVHV